MAPSFAMLGVAMPRLLPLLPVFCLRAASVTSEDVVEAGQQGTVSLLAGLEPVGAGDFTHRLVVVGIGTACRQYETSQPDSQHCAATAAVHGWSLVRLEDSALATSSAP